jgi:triosephosphate isomerase
MPTRQRIIGGNWKMNTTLASARDLAGAVCRGLGSSGSARVVLIPPFPYLLAARDAIGSTPRVALGAQDVYFEPDGAFTGEVSAAMLKDCGCAWVLAGHSERRHVLGESDAIVNRKATAALAAGLNVILCVGEKLEERTAGQTDAVNERQLRAGLAGVSAEQLTRVVVAYEPVWAIGTGKTATPADAQDAHAKIRGVLGAMFSPAAAAATVIQYGGSVKAANAAELFAQPDIDGGLIGGASLKADEFLAIVKAAG